MQRHGLTGDWWLMGLLALFLLVVLTGCVPGLAIARLYGYQGTGVAGPCSTQACLVQQQGGR
jgi:hypothetical protein